MKNDPEKDFPAEIIEIFGPPPILTTEDKKSYYLMFKLFVRDIPVHDTLTWLLVKDLTDYRLEITRYRRFKAAGVRIAHANKKAEWIKQARDHLGYQIRALRGSADIEITKALQLQPYDAERIENRKAELEKWYNDNVELKRKESDKGILLMENHVANEADFVNAFSGWIADHDKLERLLENAERKFILTLREIERHILGFGKALREELKIIEGEVLKQVEEKKTAPMLIASSK